MRTLLRRSRSSFVALLFVLLAAPLAIAQPFSTSMLRPVGYHLSPIFYFNVPYFADAFSQGEGWRSFTGTDPFGTPVAMTAPQFDENGFPQFLNPGQGLRAIVFGLNIGNPFRPAAWPSLETLAKGRTIVTWKGNADIRLVNCTFVATGSNGAATGSIADGRRIYLCTGPGQSTQSIEVRSMTTAITEIHVWLAPPDNPATTEKENETGTLENQFFHPILLQRIADRDWGFIRFMDWGPTNASPQQDWIDRRLPTHAFRSGVLNARSPGGGADGNRETGAAFEHMVRLCNETGRNMWINVPHLATDDFMTKLAQLIRFGSDGRNPHTSLQANPAFPPLRSDLKVFVEYSNEIWSSGFSFPQGNFAEGEAARLGLTKAQFNARRFCDTWRTFQQVFGGTDRLVRVAAIFTALDSYSRAFLQEIGTYGLTLSPQVRPDVLAPTTYFGNGIQDFVNEQNFAGGKLFNDPYWTSALFVQHRQTAFAEWTRRILAGDSAQGAGFDATSIGGGFSGSLRTLPNETLGYSLPIVAYEGGPSLFTDSIDTNAVNAQGVPTDDHVTTFIEAMNRDPLIKGVYDIHLNLAKSKALWTHTPYTDALFWSRFGQWGHLETFDQNPTNAPKYSLMLSHFDEFTSTSIRHINEPLGLVPQFTTASTLPPAIVGQTYTVDVLTSGGNGSRTVKIIGSFLDSGLTAVPVAGSPDRFRVSGSPLRSQKNFIHARVVDSDGDPSWQIFTLESFGGPGTLVQSNFRGTSPALNTPFATTHVLSPKVSWSGWTVSRPIDATGGVRAESGDDAFVFSLDAPSAGNSTLTEAIAENEFLRATVTPVGGALDLRGAEVRFLTRRIGFHSPTGYALASSIGGFTQAAALFVSTNVSKDDFGEREHVVILPSTTAFASVPAGTPIEFRIYAFGAQFGGHRTSLSGFKLTEKVVVVPVVVKGDANGDGIVTAADIFYLINNLFAGGPPPV